MRTGQSAWGEGGGIGSGVCIVRSLDPATDVHQKCAAERAFRERAGGDSLDVGNSNPSNSVLDPDHRAWLTATYGVQFMTFEDIVAKSQVGAR